MKKNNLIMTAAEKAEIKINAAKRELMGSEFRCHNGKRSMVQRNAKKENRRWNHKDKRECME